MNPDKLEKYILDHREQFDDQEPDPAIWEKVDTRKSTVIRINWKDIAWKAAAVAVIFVASYYFHDYMSSRKQASQNLAGNNAEINSPMLRQLLEAEAYYTSQINLRKEEVFRLTASDPDVRHEVDLEMVDLERVFQELKADLKDNADNEEVIEAMIQNYRMKLDILEEMLLRLKQSNDSQNEESHEDTLIAL